MKTYALKRLLISVPLVFIMTFVVFCIINITASKHFASFMNDEGADPQVIEIETRRLHMHEPVPVRYLYWLQGVLFDVRVTQQRRYIATFEDNDPGKGDDRYLFAGTVSKKPLSSVSGTYDVGGEKGAPMGALATAEGVRATLVRRDVQSIEFTAAAPAPQGLALIINAGSGQVPYPFTAEKDGSARLILDLDEMSSKAEIEQILSIEIDSAKPEKAVVTAQAVSRPIWQEAYPGEQRKRTIQVSFPGTPSYYGELGALKSPYVSKGVDRSDWAPDWNAVQAKLDEGWKKSSKAWAESGKRGPEPEKALVERIDFDRLEFEARAVEGGPFKAEIQLLTGGPEKVTPVRIGEVELGESTHTHIITFDSFPKDLDLHRVTGIRIVSVGKGRGEFDDFRLRVKESPIGCGTPNFGESWHKKQSVLTLIFGKVKNTILLTLWELFFIWLIALPAGVYGAVRQYSTGDKVISFLTFVGMAMPSFFLAILMIFFVTLTYEIPKDSMWFWLNGLFPIAGRTSQNHSEMSFGAQMFDVARHMVLPATVAILGGIGGLQRIVRATMLEERRKLYVTTAMAKGLPPSKVLFKHALRNAMIPFVASAGSILPGMIGGSAFIEIIFEYPGIGKQMYESVLTYDVPVVMANTLIVGLLLVVGNLLADFALGWVDPRISLEN
ncbi:MAG: ABC transporter permease subunit [Planctomycetota bacterium]